MSFFSAHSFIIKALISVAVLLLLAGQLNWEATTHVVQYIKPMAWVYALVFLFLQIMALAWRWMVMINVNTSKIDYSESLKVTLAALLANLLLINSIGGIIARVAMTMQYGVSWVKSACAAIADRFMTLAALLALAIIMLPLLGDYFDKTTYGIIGLGIVAVAGIGLLIPLFLLNMSNKRTLFSNRKMAAAFAYARGLLTDQAIMGQIILASLMGQIFYFTAVYFVSASSGADISLLALMSVLPAITLVASLPLGFGGWGIRESAFIYGLGLLGIPMETAFLISVQVGLLTMVSTALAAGPAFMSKDFRALMGKTKAVNR